MAGVLLLLPLLLVEHRDQRLMATQGIGVNINTLPLVTVGVGFGIDYGLYIVSRIIEEIRSHRRPRGVDPRRAQHLRARR